jgi:hypothetical protein
VCLVAPPQQYDTDQSRKVAGEINAKILDYFKVGASLTTEQKNVVKESFQSVGEKAACAMLLQAYVCLGTNGKADLAKDLQSSISGACKPGSTSATAAEGY